MKLKMNTEDMPFFQFAEVLSSSASTSFNVVNIMNVISHTVN